MRKLILLLILCAWPVTASAHPGKTDKYGGHMCLKGCEEWKLFYKEYHLHDKYGKPIRMGRKKAAAAPQNAEPLSAAAATVVAEPMSAAVQTVTVYRSVTTVYEEDVFSSNPLLWAVLVLLLFLLLLRRNRKEPENPRP
jgi:hypothetical protein